MTEQIDLSAVQALAMDLYPEDAEFHAFLSVYYCQVLLEDLETGEPEYMLALCYAHWLFLKSSFGDLGAVRVFNPSPDVHGWQSNNTVIQIACPDMPFIVDSIKMALNKHDVDIQFVLFLGGVKVKSTDDGFTTEFSTTVRSECNVRTPVYIEIERQYDDVRCEALSAALQSVLHDVYAAVSDWGIMKARLSDIIEDLDAHYRERSADAEQAVSFLRWLSNDHFVFLGARDYDVVHDGDEVTMRLCARSGVGVLANETKSRVVRRYSELPPLAREQALCRDRLVIVAKTNTVSTVHRHDYTDYIGIKKLDADGKLIGERRFIGLFTSSVYLENPEKIPYIRQKVHWILSQCHFQHDDSERSSMSHAAKAMKVIIASLPRDDLFHGSKEELYEICLGILHFQERKRVRVFIRQDLYCRYYSVMVFLPEENFSSEKLEKIIVYLKSVLHGTELTYNTYFSSSVLIRICFNIRVIPGQQADISLRDIEEDIAKMTHSWNDAFLHALKDRYDHNQALQLYNAYRRAFPSSYRENYLPSDAIDDIVRIQAINHSGIGTEFYQINDHLFGFKLLSHGIPIALAEVLPIFSHFGLRVEGEHPFRLCCPNETVWINDFTMKPVMDRKIDLNKVKLIVEQAFCTVWHGDADNDAFNQLVIYAGLTIRQVCLLRTYSHYMKQIKFPYSLDYIGQTLIKYPEISIELCQAFDLRFSPERNNQVKYQQYLETITHRLKALQQLDEDKIIRMFTYLIAATVRTNFFQKNVQGVHDSALVLKLMPEGVPGIPLPAPYYEIFVHSPCFQGTHIRAGLVSRGGIRLSRRKEDYRDECLGLVSAQIPKNTHTTPTGGKGAILIHDLALPEHAGGLADYRLSCYRLFIAGLLSVIDINKVQTGICYDQVDDILVVAADAGTSTFSDDANDVANQRHYWLGDAFASGGRCGYDHKKMGITAAGAIVAAAREFWELEVDIHSQAITIVGVGGMCGDVFGNFMLFSPYFRLIAAFDGEHIFIDPNPDNEVAYQERQRLFKLPGSGWNDYDLRCVSKGGGVFNRSAKSIPLTPEIQQCLGVQAVELEPNEIIQCILRADVDLFFNGGIGTYFKAKSETHDQVSDSSNASVRINAQDARARVIVEGGNLGVTKQGRVEFAASGGRIQADFIDNAGGVKCSDIEVNIKILLAEVSKTQKLPQARDHLLMSMTDEVSMIVQNGLRQFNRAISMECYHAQSRFSFHWHFLESLSDRQPIDRTFYSLPSNDQIQTRERKGEGFLRPEICALFTLAKADIKSELLHSDLHRDSVSQYYAASVFPKTMMESMSSHLDRHRLYKEIVATEVTNHCVSHAGFSFVYQLKDEIGVSVSTTVKAYCTVFALFSMQTYYDEIDALDFLVMPGIQHDMLGNCVQFLRRVTRWFLRHEAFARPVDDVIDSYQADINQLVAVFPKSLPASDQQRVQALADQWIKAGVPEVIATRHANLKSFFHSVNVIYASHTIKQSPMRVLPHYMDLVDQLSLVQLRYCINDYPAKSRWTVRGKAILKEELDALHRALSIQLLQYQGDMSSADYLAQCLQASQVFEEYQKLIKRITVNPTDSFEPFVVAVHMLKLIAGTINEQTGDSDQGA